MATQVPSPVLDLRNEDQVVAECIGALPPELSDRSDSNPAVAIIEAVGAQFGKVIFQLNQFGATAVIQKCLALVGVTLNPATPGTVTETFTLSAPQPLDTVIAAGATVSTSDGSLVYTTTSDMTIRAFSAPAGTISLTAGSATVTGSGTSFTTDAPVGYQISTDKITWYMVASVVSDTSLTLTQSAASTVAGSSYYSGAVSGSVTMQATTTGVASSAAAGALTTVQSAGPAVASATNPAAASGGADLETTTAAIARAPLAFAAGGSACSAADYSYFAAKILGTGGRAYAQANTNNTTAQTGYVTVAMLSPGWTTSTPVSAQERANVIRDLAARTYAGATTVDVAANIQSFNTAGSGSSTGTMFACAFYRKAAIDSVSARIAAAAQVNTYLSPNTYPWGRTIDPDDLANQLAPSVVSQIDHIATINGVLAVGMNYTVVANNVTFTNGSTTATGTASDFTNMTANQTFLMDQTNGAVYLVTNISSGTLTITPSYTGPSSAFMPAWFTSKPTVLTNWYSLPFSLLSINSSTPPASILVVGSV